VLLRKNNQNKTIHKNLNFYPKFIPKDGCQMVNINIITFCLFKNLFFNILSSKCKLYIYKYYKN
jgi:hypothetical protein